MERKDINLKKLEDKATKNGWCPGQPIYKFLDETDYHIWRTCQDQKEINKSFGKGYYKAREEEMEFLEEWLEMYSEGEHRMLVSEIDISDRIKQLKTPKNDKKN